MNREAESGAMRPLARALTKSLEKVRGLLRDASLCNDQTTPCLRNLISSLCTFDHLLAEFELRYVSAMVPVKTAHEYELQQLVVVLFSETLQRYVAACRALLFVRGITSIFSFSQGTRQGSFDPRNGRRLRPGPHVHHTAAGHSVRSVVLPVHVAPVSRPKSF